MAPGGAVRARPADTHRWDGAAEKNVMPVSAASRENCS